MSSTLFRGRVYSGIQPPTDRSVAAAIERAATLLPLYEGKVWTALADRNDGLLLRFIGTELGGWHFQTPRCGDNDDELKAAAQILQIFGFGKYEDLLDQLKFAVEAQVFHHPQAQHARRPKRRSKYHQQ